MNNPLTYDADQGTKVEVQSHFDTSNFHEGVVGKDGKVWDSDKIAVYNGDSYSVVKEIE